MNKNVKSAGFITILALFALASTASAYTIDGDINDWGIDLSTGLAGTDSAWIPASPTADWKVEDNIDDDCSPFTWLYGNCKDWTGYQAQGTHIQGNGSDYQNYDEPANVHGTRLYDGPAGGEGYDLEALYFDDSEGFVYFAIVTSMPETGYTDQYGRHVDTGDLALDVDDNSGTGQFGYEYGIKTHGPNKGQICYMPVWTLPQASMGFPQNAPSTMSCDGPQSVIKGYAGLVYSNAGVADNGFDNYIIETKVHKYYLGSPQMGDNGKLHTAVTCGNDVIEIGQYSYDFPAPEFTSILIPLLILIMSPLAAYKISKRR